MRYLLDTNIVSNLVKDPRGRRTFFAQAPAFT
jgi:predicted nucleic acid-binding protein